MVKESKVGHWKQRKLELVQALEYTRKLSQTVEAYSSQLASAYREGRLSYLEYKAREQKVFQGRSAQEWMRYYASCSQYYAQELQRLESLENKEEKKIQNLGIVALSIFFIILLGFGTYTGYDTIVELLTEENVSEDSAFTDEVLQEEIIESSAGSEANESAADVPEEAINIAPGATIMPVEENLSEEALEENLSETIIEIPVEENITKENLSKDIAKVAPELIENVTEEIENITKALVPEVNKSIVTEEKVLQHTARVGQSVRWSKTVHLEQEETNMSVDIPRDAQLIGIKEIENAVEKDIPAMKISINISGDVQELERYEHQRDRKTVQLSFFGGLFSWIGNFLASITGLAIFEESPVVAENMSLIIEEVVQEVVVDYYTEAPVAIEEQTEFGKRITISSETHYENIVSFTTLPDVDAGSIQLYWIVNGSRQVFSYTPYDLNNNTLVDYIEWITPHLSNETFEIELSILTVQSYPVVGGNWTVEFNTTGIADLRISAFNGTNWSLSNSTRDLTFLEVQCGEIEQGYQWIENTIVIENYSCSQTGSETSKVLTAGVHTLQFSFGNITKYAYNLADYSSCPDISGNVTVSTNTVWSNTSFTCDYITVTNNAVLTLNNTAAGNTTINITAYEINVTSGAAIDAGNTGFLGQQGPGRAENSGGTGESGAGHGGIGGETGLDPGTVYDSVTYPLQMGSGGDIGTVRTNGRGAGAIHMNVTGTLIVDGVINVSASTSAATGGGSGGALLLNVTSINGSGSLLATGGRALGSGDAGGAGGRIALYYKTNNFLGTIDASGGNSSSAAVTAKGGAGTIFLKFINQSNGELIIENRNVTRGGQTILNTTVFSLNVLDNLTVTNKSNVLIDVALTINNTEFIMGEETILVLNTDFNASRVALMNISGSIQLTANYTFNESMVMRLFSGANLSHQENTNASGASVFILNLTMKNLTIDSGAIIDVSRKGYRASQGPGGAIHLGATNDPGGAYGGVGGSEDTRRGKPYGNLTSPLHVGSGGEGAEGAGAIFFNVTDTLTIDGTLNASAITRSGTAVGGGSGGSIYLIARTFAGTGSLVAKGGSSNAAGDGSGSGGRIALYYLTRTFTGEINVSGGNSSDANHGLAGSLFSCQSTATVNCTGAGGSKVLAHLGNITLITEYTLNTTVVINKTINVTWSRSSINWTDASNNITDSIAIHNLTGLSENANYTIKENTSLNSTQISNASGALKFFNTGLISQMHDINVYNTSSVAAGVVGLKIDDSAIAFGSGYYDASCTQGYSLLNSNTSRNCWINTTAFMSTEDVHLITNNGTIAGNVTARVQVQDAEEFFCGSSGGCPFTDNALISIEAVDNEASSCTGLPTGFTNLSTYNSNLTAALCNSLSSTDASNQIKTRVRFHAPKDTTAGSKNLIIVYEIIAA